MGPRSVPSGFINRISQLGPRFNNVTHFKPFRPVTVTITVMVMVTVTVSVTITVTDTVTVTVTVTVIQSKLSAGGAK